MVLLVCDRREGIDDRACWRVGGRGPITPDERFGLGPREVPIHHGVVTGMVPENPGRYRPQSKTGISRSCSARRHAPGPASRSHPLTHRTGKGRCVSAPSRPEGTRCLLSASLRRASPLGMVERLGTIGTMSTAWAYCVRISPRALDPLRPVHKERIPDRRRTRPRCARFSHATRMTTTTPRQC